jgi:anti-sigma factor RsiW
MTRTSELCQTFEEDLSALLDRELPAAREAEVRAHLEGCADCQVRLAAFSSLNASLRGVGARPVPADLEARLLARVGREDMALPRHGASERSRPGRRPRLAPAILVAALAAAAAVVVYLGVVRGPGVPVPGLPIAQRPERRTEERPAPPAASDLDAASEEELSLAIELDTLEDLDVIANLDLLEQMEPGGGKDRG